MPVVFLFSGVLDTLCTQQLVYQGASDMRSMFSIFSYYFAQALIGITPIKFSDEVGVITVVDLESSGSLENEVDKHIQVAKNMKKLKMLYVLSALLDIAGYVIRTIGMVYCGSGLFQVAFSSVAIFSAIYSHFLLKTYISNMQWLGILVVTFGLCISPLSGSTVTGSPYIGICLTLLGAQFYALSYIVNEMILRIPGNKGSKEICKNVGLLNTFLCLLVILLDTIPNREQLVFSPLRARHATLQEVLISTAVYIGSHTLHSYALYSVQGILGAIWTGLLQCIRACIVFIVSSYLYCSEDPNQCLTYSKIVATIIVTTGIIIFTMGKQRVASHLLSDSGTENQWFVLMIVEFRVPLPFCLDNPMIGYRYMNLKACESATGGGEGVEWLVEENYDNTDGHLVCDIDGFSIPRNKGVYTLKHYLITSKLPSWLVKLLPSDSIFLEEKAWISSEYRFAIITFGCISKKRFQIVLEMKYVNQDRGTIENIFNLSEEQLKSRTVQHYDVCDAYKSEIIPDNENICKFSSQHISGSPLSPGWWRNRPLNTMCCQYWLLHINFHFFGLQQLGETLIFRNQCYMNRQTERQMLTMIDSWIHLSEEDIYRLELEGMDELKNKMKSSERSMAYTSGI
ncbi:uncharacterized protein [Blastocystis hominis]|uniref:Uncharacterized protein n=1 Tax=Blastocystis hominis TaxID=12968 RepID=D8M9B3_BLAHO|nr:uncharacterized protein [Blastocystis hominis]CBK24652.2 unnamed protein product [Blastocystis hominis]|eukprot:XP_012898700.1 uncharacterized protein [Blastocystis hominis]